MVRELPVEKRDILEHIILAVGLRDDGDALLHRPPERDLRSRLAVGLPNLGDHCDRAGATNGDACVRECANRARRRARMRGGEGVGRQCEAVR